MKPTLMPGSNLLLICLFLLTTALGCSDDNDLDFSAPGSLQFSYEKPDDNGQATPEAIARNTASFGPTENREALLVILKGFASNNRETPYRVEFIRAVQSEIYQHIAEPEDSSFWITRAEVHDEDGNVLWSEPVNSLFQSLELLKLLLDQSAGFNFTLPQVYNLVNADYPELVEFAVRVPLGIEGGHDYVLTIPNNDGETIEIGRFAIDELVAAAEPVRFPGEVTALYESGPSDDRVDVVILSDGYTADQREKFELDAQATANRMLETTPLSEHRDMFNIWAIWTPSNESGAGYDCTRAQPDCVQGFRDTFYNTVFVIPAVGDKFGLDVSNISDRVAMPISIGKVFETAAHVPFDEIIVLSNSQKRAGFAGLYVSLVTSWDRSEFPDVAVHEFGHTFGLLGDEYMAAGDPCFFNEPRIPLPPNITAAPTSDAPLKWRAWVKDGTPIPTPTNMTHMYPVGAYQRAYNCEFLYRPSFDCKMNSSSEEFCPVCAEQMVRRLYSVFNVTPNEPTSVEALSTERLRFTVPVHEASRRHRVEWKIGGEVIGQSPTLDLSTRPIETYAEPGQWLELTADIYETSGFIRQQDPRTHQRFSWWVRTAP